MASIAPAALRDRTIAVVAGLIVVATAGGVLLLRNDPVASSTAAAATAKLPAPPPPWTAPQLHDLIDAVRGAAAEGLRSSDYKLAALKQAARVGQTGAPVDALADAAAAGLAHDYAAGRVRSRHRFNWYIDYAGPDAASLAAAATAAREKGQLGAWLAGLLPANAPYRALRVALAATPGSDVTRRDRIKANLERWRWLPRDFGRGDQLYVNLPTYQLEVIRGGATAASYKAVIGATDMPTPVLSAPVRQVIANPDWIVPQSIVRKSHLRPGASSRYVFSTRPDGSVRVRQKPGPGNALGRIKIEFPNKLAIYFHDTPSRSLFGADVRAFSHGCVRVQNIEALAASIVRDQDRLAAALEGTSTRSVAVLKPLQANIVYLTLAPDANGGLSDLGDPYAMDEPLAAALEGRRPVPKVAPAAAKPAVHSSPPPRMVKHSPAAEQTPKPRRDAVDPAPPVPPVVREPEAPAPSPPADTPPSAPVPGNTN